MTMRRVLFVAEWIPSYLLEFYGGLTRRLASHGVQLEVAHGDPPPEMARRRTVGRLDDATHRRSRTVPLGGRRLVWQPVTDRARVADLVIVEQASRLLVNYWLLAQQRTGGARVALWGHGANLNEYSASPIAESIKRWTSLHPHWWFAYTKGTEERVAALGYPRDRITVVQNAGATDPLRAEIERLKPVDEVSVRNQLTLGEGPVGLYIGSLYAEKRLDFLVAAADEVVRALPEFRLVIAGDGPLREMVAAQAARRPHVIWAGHVNGERKATLLKTACVLLLPGAVGLAIVDGFAAGVPTISTAVATHGPEIEYLQDGVNGRLLPVHTTPSRFAETVIEVVREGDDLRTGAAEAGRLYSTETMIARFSEGIREALTAGPTPRSRPPARRGRRGQPSSPRHLQQSVVLTTSWDDGTPEDLPLGELLTRYGFRGTFYATTGPGGQRTIGDADVHRLIGLGHEVGNHGRTHRRFVELSIDEVLDEIRWGQTEIARFGQTALVVAPPGGATNPAINRLINDQGLIVRTAPILGTRRAHRGVMVPTAQVFPHGLGTTTRHLVRRRALPASRYLRAWARSRSVRERLDEIIATADPRTPVLHFWGHSQEIDRLGLWRDLELLLERAAEATLAPATNGELAAADHPC